LKAYFPRWSTEGNFQHSTHIASAFVANFQNRLFLIGGSDDNGGQLDIVTEWTGSSFDLYPQSLSQPMKGPAKATVFGF